MFLAGFESQKSGIENRSYVFVETVLPEMADNGSLDDWLECNVDRWTKSTTFMDAFANRALSSSRCASSVAKFMHRSVEQQTDEIEQERKQLGSPSSLPGTPSAPSKSPDDDKRRKHAKRKHVDSDSVPEDAK